MAATTREKMMPCVLMTKLFLRNCSAMTNASYHHQCLHRKKRGGENEEKERRKLSKWSAKWNKKYAHLQ